MQLVPLLLVISAAISLFSGLIVLFGSRRKERLKSFLFSIAMFFFMLWTIASILDGFGLMGIEKVAGLTENLLFISGLAAFFFLFAMIDWKQSLRKDRVGKGWRTMIAGLLISGLAGFVTCIILPCFGIFVRWGGPLIATISIILYCYAFLRYRIVPVSNKNLKYWSKILAISIALMAYIVIFFLISKYLFHIDSSTEILALNLVMVIILFLIFPVLNEVNSGINSLSSMRDVNMEYIIKRLNRMSTQNVKIDDLADFLADYMHFQNIVFIINGKVYASTPLKLKKDQYAQIMKIKRDDKTLWQRVDEDTWELLKSVDIRAVAELRDAKGKPFGQILVGKPIGRITLEKDDLTQLEKVINIVASIIDSKERLKKR